MVSALSGQFKITIRDATDLPKPTMTLLALDPKIELLDSRGNVILEGPKQEKTENPKWNVSAQVSLADARALIFKVWNVNIAIDDLLCEATLAPGSAEWESLERGDDTDMSIPMTRNGKETKCKLNVQITPLFHKVPGNLCVPSARFNAHKNCRVTLFQSAHIGSERDYLPNLQHYGGKTEFASGAKMSKHKAAQQDFHKVDNQSGPRDYTPRNCWEELYVSILEAKNLIYVVGWSVMTGITLLRERNIVVPGYEQIDGTKTTLGEILQMKAEEGLKVNILIWNELTSCATSVAEFGGVAATCAGQTRQYFEKKGDKVKVAQQVRNGVVGASHFGFTHHQKCVLVDAPSLEGQRAPRRMIAFMGGLDVTGGRFDTPKKHIYDKRNSWFADDYYQACVGGADARHDPRQPWQDIHSKLEGSIVWDLLTNFHDRWITQGAEGAEVDLFDFKKLVAQDDIAQPNESGVCGDNCAEGWNVQFFRSMDKHSGDMVQPIEADIQLAYEHAIKNARRFIYVENQYFMGGANQYDMEGKKKGIAQKLKEKLFNSEYEGPVNRIPLMLVERIIRAIDEKDSFTVYVCMPMFPEGLPGDAPLQEVIHWEHQTMKMMYKLIGEHLKKVGSTKKPTDYINFFCLGNRQRCPFAKRQEKSTPRQDMLAESQRHMIYVHSKMLIVDDDYVILGSANINDRSMAGNRDTEVAIGAYQPHFSRDQGVSYPTGHIHAFRMSLWGEHLNEGATPEPVLFYPESQECVNYIQARTHKAWEEHVQEQFTEQTCHMMAYPIEVDKHGKIDEVCKLFPDFPDKACVKGTSSDLIPDFMTT